MIRMGKYFPAWRKVIYENFSSFYFCRTGRTADGTFDVYVSPGCQLSVLSLRGVPIDPVHQRLIDRWVKVDSVVWDIGANMGLFAFPAALKAKNGHVICFEPDVELASNLLRSVRRPRNKSLNISIFSLALSDSEGAARFLISRYGRSMNKLDGVGEWHDDLFVVRETRSVGLMRIDTLAKTLAPPDLIKIDVEGAEMQVLNGGKETIATCRPIFLVEGPDMLRPAMRAFFTEFNYVIYDGSKDNAPLIECPTWDTVAVPKEKWIDAQLPLNI